MAEQYFPFDAGPGADSYEDRWRRMARLWVPSGVVGSVGDDAYNLTVSGLTATIHRRASTGVAEAWVDGFMHRLITADWTNAVTPETTANPRIDRIVLRLDAVANTVTLARLQGTAAESPTAQPLTQVDDGVWEYPLWRFTVPASSGAPLTNLIDDRTWIGPELSGNSRIVTYGSMSSSQGVAASTTSRVLGGLNLSPTLVPGRLYEYELGGAYGSVDMAVSVRVLLGATAPTSSTGIAVAGAITPARGALPALGQFTVGSFGTYTLSPFASNLTAGGGSFAPAVAGVPMTAVIRDAGPSAGVVGSTPIAVP